MRGADVTQESMFSYLTLGDYDRLGKAIGLVLQ